MAHAVAVHEHGRAAAVSCLHPRRPPGARHERRQKHVTAISLVHSLNPRHLHIFSCACHVLITTPSTASSLIQRNLACLQLCRSFVAFESTRNDVSCVYCTGTPILNMVLHSLFFFVSWVFGFFLVTQQDLICG